MSIQHCCSNLSHAISSCFVCFVTVTLLHLISCKWNYKQEHSYHIRYKYTAAAEMLRKETQIFTLTYTGAVQKRCMRIFTHMLAYRCTNICAFIHSLLHECRFPTSVCTHTHTLYNCTAHIQLHTSIPPYQYTCRLTHTQ